MFLDLEIFGFNDDITTNLYSLVIVVLHQLLLTLHKALVTLVLILLPVTTLIHLLMIYLNTPLPFPFYLLS